MILEKRLNFYLPCSSKRRAHWWHTTVWSSVRAEQSGAKSPELHLFYSKCQQNIHFSNKSGFISYYKWKPNSSTSCTNTFDHLLWPCSCSVFQLKNLKHVYLNNNLQVLASRLFVMPYFLQGWAEKCGYSSKVMESYIFLSCILKTLLKMYSISIASWAIRYVQPVEADQKNNR